MRRAARVDRNHSEIVEALRRVGASVQPLHGVHDGVPDLLRGLIRDTRKIVPRTLDLPSIPYEQRFG